MSTSDVPTSKPTPEPATTINNNNNNKRTRDEDKDQEGPPTNKQASEPVKEQIQEVIDLTEESDDEEEQHDEDKEERDDVVHLTRENFDNERLFACRHAKIELIVDMDSCSSECYLKKTDFDRLDEIVATYKAHQEEVERQRLEDKRKRLAKDHEDAKRIITYVTDLHDKWFEKEEKIPANVRQCVGVHHKSGKQCRTKNPYYVQLLCAHHWNKCLEDTGLLASTDGIYEASSTISDNFLDWSSDLSE